MCSSTIPFSMIPISYSLSTVSISTTHLKIYPKSKEKNLLKHKTLFWKFKLCLTQQRNSVMNIIFLSIFIIESLRTLFKIILKINLATSFAPHRDNNKKLEDCKTVK